MAHPEPLPSDHSGKRKRATDDGGHDRIPQPPPPQSGNGAHINYLARNPARLQLVQGDPDVFSDVLGLIGEYEGVLSRQESLAASLGAKLTGPRLVKAMEGLFDGPITVQQRDPYNSSPVTWLDIVQFAKTNPNDFTLSNSDQRGRSCTFHLKGNQVEITEDDWRLIMTGTPDRFNLAQPLDEDENSEAATLEILEQRLQVLIKKADEVARKARQLNYHLSGRKAAINSRRPSMHSPTAHHHAGFQPVNQQQAQFSRSNTGYDLHADLLQQFTASTASLSRPGLPKTSQHSVSLPSTPVISQAPSHGTTAKQTTQTAHGSSRAPSVTNAVEAPSSKASQSDDEPYRPLVNAKIERLFKGDAIHPPCDRCRRLKVQCIKHLTACQGCTKKHARCVWKALTAEEVAWLEGKTTSTEAEADADDGSYTPDPQSASSTSIVETRSFAPVNQAGASVNGVPGGNTTGASMAASEPRSSSDRQLPEFGLREQPSARSADNYRLSHMATIALNSEGRDRDQPSKVPPLPRSESAPRD